MSHDPAVPLTQYAWALRYPGEPEQPTREEAEEALTLSRQAYNALLDVLPKAVRS